MVIRYFQRLSSAEGCEGGVRVEAAGAAAEAGTCADLLSQAQWHVARARRQHDEEVTLRDRQREQREAFRRQQVLHTLIYTASHTDETTQLTLYSYSTQHNTRICGMWSKNNSMVIIAPKL